MYVFVSLSVCLTAEYRTLYSVQYVHILRYCICIALPHTHTCIWFAGSR